MERDGVRYKLISDYVGSVRMVVNAEDNTIVQEIEYDDFGRVLSDTNPGFQPFYFAGGLYDVDTKLTRFGAREYDAEIARWISVDPIRFEGRDTNLYSYSFNDPVNYIDIDGKLPVFVAFPLAGLVGGAIAGGIGGFLNTPGNCNRLAGALEGAITSGAAGFLAGVGGATGGASAGFTAVIGGLTGSLIAGLSSTASSLPCNPPPERQCSER